MTGISHVCFLVSNLDAARAFYGDWLGLRGEAMESEGADAVAFWVNGRQYVEIRAGLPAGRDERLSHIALATADVAGMRAYLAERGVSVGDIQKDWDGSAFFSVTDPDGHRIDFTEKPAKQLEEAEVVPVSDRLLHTGIVVADPAAADAFYVDVLGLSEFWRGGSSPERTNWINMQLPESTDYLEYILVDGPPTRQRLGSAHHICLQVPDMQEALDLLRSRPDPRPMGGPKVGRNDRWLFNMFDPDGTRTELMEPHTVR